MHDSILHTTCYTCFHVIGRLDSSSTCKILHNLRPWNIIPYTVELAKQPAFDLVIQQNLSGHDSSMHWSVDECHKQFWIQTSNLNCCLSHVGFWGPMHDYTGCHTESCSWPCKKHSTTCMHPRVLFLSNPTDENKQVIAWTLSHIVAHRQLIINLAIPPFCHTSAQGGHALTGWKASSCHYWSCWKVIPWK